MGRKLLYIWSFRPINDEGPPGGGPSVTAWRRGLFGVLAGGRLDLLGELLELLREGEAEALYRSLDAVDAEFRREVVVLEQVVVGRRLDRHGRFDRHRAVVLQPGCRRDQLADDDVLL